MGESIHSTIQHILRLYLYLCGNQDGFPLALSSADIQKRLNVSDSSYRRAVDDLLAAGYLMMRNDKKNTMDFYTSPQQTSYVKKDRKKKSSTGGGAASAASVSIEKASCEPDSYEAYLKNITLPLPVNGGLNLLPLFHARSA